VLGGGFIASTMAAANVVKPDAELLAATQLR
jgi:hypothetical protein